MALSAEDKAQKIQERQNARFDAYVEENDLPFGLTVGYIGSTWSDGSDDRRWFIFRPHPGRVGTSDDSIGGYPTAERGKLIPLINAIVWAA